MKASNSDFQNAFQYPCEKARKAPPEALAWSGREPYLTPLRIRPSIGCQAKPDFRTGETLILQEMIFLKVKLCLPSDLFTIGIAELSGSMTNLDISNLCLSEAKLTLLRAGPKQGALIRSPRRPDLRVKR
jgi:hypothetical protein